MTVRAVERAGARPAPGARMSDRLWVTVSEAAEATGYSRTHVQFLARENADLPIHEQKVRVDKTSERGYLIYLPSLREYIEHGGYGPYPKKD